MAITLGLVEAIDSNGVYVSMPGSRGVLRGPYHTLQNVTAGDRVLVVRTDDGEDVIVGQAAAESSRSLPASSTDNTIARFDSTGGALQGSGVTIGDDSSIGINPTAAGYLFIGSAGSGHAAAIQAHTGAAGSTSTRRWWFGKQQAAETGSNAGSNFGIYAYDDSGSGLGYGLEINRATRKVTVSTPGATAGLEFGSSGPRIMAGTGSPESVVSAPVGSLWLRTDSSTTLYVKQTGTGNTGWIAK